MDDTYKKFIERAESFKRTQEQQKSFNEFVTKELIHFEDLSEEDRENLIEHFPKWAPSVSYNVGDIIRHNGVAYEVVQDHQSQAHWLPNETKSLYKDYRESDSDNDEGEVIYDWKQPLGAFDSYQTGDVVYHNDKVWKSNVDNNTWEPSIYGWEEVDT